MFPRAGMPSFLRQRQRGAHETFARLDPARSASGGVANGLCRPRLRGSHRFASRRLPVDLIMACVMLQAAGRAPGAKQQLQEPHVMRAIAICGCVNVLSRKSLGPRLRGDDNERFATDRQADDPVRGRQSDRRFTRSVRWFSAGRRSFRRGSASGAEPPQAGCAVPIRPDAKLRPNAETKTPACAGAPVLLQ